MAERSFGPAARAAGGEYLHAWVTTAPAFSRETTDFFMDRPVTSESVEQVAAGCRGRLALLDGLDSEKLGAAGRERVAYWRGMENFITGFFPGGMPVPAGLQGAAEQ